MFFVVIIFSHGFSRMPPDVRKSVWPFEAGCTPGRVGAACPWPSTSTCNMTRKEQQKRKKETSTVQKRKTRRNKLRHLVFWQVAAVTLVAGVVPTLVSYFSPSRDDTTPQQNGHLGRYAARLPFLIEDMGQRQKHRLDHRNTFCPINCTSVGWRTKPLLDLDARPKKPPELATPPWACLLADRLVPDLVEFTSVASPGLTCAHQPDSLTRGRVSQPSWTSPTAPSDHEFSTDTLCLPAQLLDCPVSLKDGMLQDGSSELLKCFLKDTDGG